MFNKKDPKKYILAAGCSFTDASWTPWFHYPDYDCSYPKWPEVLGGKLGVDTVVNLGKSGNCNENIINRVIDHILHEEKPWLVVIGLTEAHRFSPYNWFSINPHLLGRDPVENTINVDLHEWTKTFETTGEWLISRDQQNGAEIMRAILENYIRQVNRIVNFCHKLNIKVIVGSLLWPMDVYDYEHYRAFHNLSKEHEWTEEAIARLFMGCQGFDDVDPNTFINWPIFPSIGGRMIWQGLDSMIIGPLDGHPNALGHQHIAEKFYEHYKKTY